MFLSATEPYVVGIVIAIVVAQYAFAIVCLLKLAYLDIPKKQYVLWNLLILLVFFIGGIAFLIYYNKVKDEKKIAPYVPLSDGEELDKAQEDEKADKPQNGEEAKDDTCERADEAENGSK